MRGTLMRLLGRVAFGLLAPVLVVACESGDHELSPLFQENQASSSLIAEPHVASARSLFEYVTDRARRLARTSYETAEFSLPHGMLNLDYDQYRSIRFRPDAALWRDNSRFEIQLFHPGYLYDEPVRINVVRNEQIVELPFDASLFLYDGTAAPVAGLVTRELGYAGFRIHYPLNDAAIKDEVAVFLGASYFRLVGPGQVYGLSSRGLAVDIGLNKAEEFPSFREFWLVQPDPEATTLTMYALLDSPSLSGAYRFELEPGINTALQVDARIFGRRDITKLGVAPMSSMFLYDQNPRPFFDDFRGQVHDSDGAMVHTGDGEWIWRPLNNGPGTNVTSLSEGTPKGFGLFQRDRSFANYLDLEALYDRRPSEWVEVGEPSWGDGHLELLSFQTRNEFNDNAALYWVPDQPLKAGEQRSFRYRLITLDGDHPVQTVGHVGRTRIGIDDFARATASNERSPRRVVVDFVGGDVSRLDEVVPVAVLDAPSGTTSDLNVQALPNGEGWRAAFQLKPRGGKSTDLRLRLEVEGRRVTETWSYTWNPQ